MKIEGIQAISSEQFCPPHPLGLKSVYHLICGVSIHRGLKLVLYEVLHGRDSGTQRDPILKFTALATRQLSWRDPTSLFLVHITKVKRARFASKK